MKAVLCNGSKLCAKAGLLGNQEASLKFHILFLFTCSFIVFLNLLKDPN